MYEGRGCLHSEFPSLNWICSGAAASGINYATACVLFYLFVSQCRLSIYLSVSVSVSVSVCLCLCLSLSVSVYLYLYLSLSLSLSLYLFLPLHIYYGYRYTRSILLPVTVDDDG